MLKTNRLLEYLFWMLPIFEYELGTLHKRQ